MSVEIHVTVEEHEGKLVASAHGQGAFLCSCSADSALKAAEAVRADARAFFPETEIVWTGWQPAVAAKVEPVVIEADPAMVEDSWDSEHPKPDEEKPKKKPAKGKIKVLGE